MSFSSEVIKYNNFFEFARQHHLSSSGSGTVAIRGAYRDPFRFLVRLWLIEGVEVNGKPDADDGVGDAEGDRYGDDTGNGAIVGEYITAPLAGIGLITDMAIMGGVGVVAGKGCPYVYPYEGFITGEGNDAESWVRGDSIV